MQSKKNTLKFRKITHCKCDNFSDEKTGVLDDRPKTLEKQIDEHLVKRKRVEDVLRNFEKTDWFVSTKVEYDELSDGFKIGIMLGCEIIVRIL